MFQYIAQEEEKPWILGPYVGVQLKILHKDEESGGVVVLRKFEAGIEVPAHIHPWPTNGLMCSQASGRNPTPFYRKALLRTKDERHSPTSPARRSSALPADSPLTMV